MATRIRSFVIAGATLAMFLTTALSSRDAHAHRGWGRGRGGPSLGGFIAGAIVGAAVGAVLTPPPPVEVYSQPVYPYPPPPPPPAPPPCCYAPPPPPVVFVQPGRPERDPEVGLAASAVFQSPRTGQMAVGGVAVDLQLLASPHTMLALELQSLGMHDLTRDERRTQLDGLLAGRLFLWDAALAPYFELAGGIGRTSVEVSGYDSAAAQLVGRAGFGLELRIGRHLVFDGGLARTSRLRLDRDRPERGSLAGFEPPSSVVVAIDDYESATEARIGLGFRF
jgi:hypothetical protein